jgi:hypothetical protein
MCLCRFCIAPALPGANLWLLCVACVWDTQMQASIQADVTPRQHLLRMSVHMVFVFCPSYPSQGPTPGGRLCLVLGLWLLFEVPQKTAVYRYSWHTRCLQARIKSL